MCGQKLTCFSAGMNIEYISVWVVEIDLISVSVVFVRVDEKVLVFVSGHRD